MPNGTKIKPTCSSCYYFDIQSFTHYCKFNPPVIFMAPHGSGDWESKGWPAVTETDWCGKHSDLHVVGGDSDES